MKRRWTISVIGFMALSVLSGWSSGQDTRLSVEGNLRVLNLDGSPFERGRAHGELLKKDIHELVGLWKADLEKSYGVKGDDFIGNFLRKTKYREAVKKWTPELWEELRGISEGSGLDFDTVFAFQLVDETWVLGREIQAEKCTTVGTSKTPRNPAIVSQNLDIPGFYHGLQTLLRIRDPEHDLETLIFTFPGFIAANGLNSRSVGVVVNAVQQLESTRDGLPVAFVIRGILERRSFNEAVRFIQEIKHGAPQNYLIGDATEVGSFECAGTTVGRFVPFEDATFTFHTNHPLKNLDYSPRFLEHLRSRNISPSEYEHPCPRFEALSARLKDNSVVFDVEMLKDIFSDRETIVNNSGTFGCTIMVLGRSPELHISPGRPDTEPFRVFGFRRD
jgi:isopenicillin-N N-acyltransferase-like protein